MKTIATVFAAAAAAFTLGLGGTAYAAAPAIGSDNVH